MLHKKGWPREETITREDVNALILMMKQMQEKHRAYKKERQTDRLPIVKEPEEKGQRRDTFAQETEQLRKDDDVNSDDNWKI